MPEDTTPTPTPTPLLTTLLTLLAAHRPAFQQDRPYQRCRVLVLGQLAAFSRHTLTQLLVALGLQQVDWSGFYRLLSVPRLDYDGLIRCFVEETLADVASDQPYLTAIDGVQQPRSSQTMPGTSWLKAPRTPPWRVGIHRAQRFLHLAWLVPPDERGYSRAIPLRLSPAFPEKAVRPADLPAQKEWEAGLAALAWLRTTLDALGRQTQRLVAVADGAYGTAALWTSLPPATTLLSRCAKNRALFRLPPPPGRRGRPRKYGTRAFRPDAWLQRTCGWQQATVTVRGRSIPLTYRVAGPYLVQGAPEQPLFLLVVRGVDRRGPQQRRREPAFWLVNAVERDDHWRLPVSPVTLLGWAWQRWEIEVTHRAAKTSFGVGELQCWNRISAILAVQWHWWVLALVLLTGYRHWELNPAPTVTTTGWWLGSRRWSLGQLLQVLRAELWQLGEYQPVWRRFPHNWWEILDRQATLPAAVLGSRRG